MGWSIGFDSNWDRDIGYGVPAICDHPSCAAEIDRGIGCVCGQDVYGGDDGCGLFFCAKHLYPSLCEQCVDGLEPFDAKPDIEKWIRHKLTDESWEKWRAENPEVVAMLTATNKFWTSKPEIAEDLTLEALEKTITKMGEKDD